MLKIRDGRWSVGSSWSSWLKCEKSSDLPPKKGWMVRSVVRGREMDKEFTLDSTLRLRFGSVGCQVLTVTSSGPIVHIFGRKYLGKFYRKEDAFNAGRPIFQNDYGMSLTMINLFGRVHYWTVHEAVPVASDNGGLYNKTHKTIQCFRLNLRRNICPALARSSDNLFSYRTAGMTENRVVEDDTLSVACDWHG